MKNYQTKQFVDKVLQGFYDSKCEKQTFALTLEEALTEQATITPMGMTSKSLSSPLSSPKGS